MAPPRGRRGTTVGAAVALLCDAADAALASPGAAPSQPVADAHVALERARLAVERAAVAWRPGAPQLGRDAVERLLRLVLAGAGPDGVAAAAAAADALVVLACTSTSGPEPGGPAPYAVADSVAERLAEAFAAAAERQAAGGGEGGAGGARSAASQWLSKLLELLCAVCEDRQRPSQAARQALSPLMSRPHAVAALLRETRIVATPRATGSRELTPFHVLHLIYFASERTDAQQAEWWADAAGVRAVGREAVALLEAHRATPSGAEPPRDLAATKVPQLSLLVCTAKRGRGGRGGGDRAPQRQRDGGAPVLHQPGPGRQLLRTSDPPTARPCRGCDV